MFSLEEGGVLNKALITFLESSVISLLYLAIPISCCSKWGRVRKKSKLNALDVAPVYVYKVLGRDITWYLAYLAFLSSLIVGFS